MKRAFTYLAGAGLIVVVVLYFLGFYARVYGQEPDMSQLSPPPLMAHGVSKCGEIVALWVLKIDPDGQVRAYRTDAEHHPDDAHEYNAFLLWVNRTPKGQLDMYEIPCPK